VEFRGNIERIRGLGYTESEARFLYIVAVFSGCFTLGQFRAFTGASYGKRPASFAAPVVFPVISAASFP